MGARKPRSELSVQQLLPNLVTVGALCAGLTAIRFMMQDRLEIAVALIGLAAILDAADGRLARLLHSESRMGAELDSLVDFLNFGVAPGLLIYIWALHDTRNAGWIAVVIYIVCCVLRLARFNAESRTESDAAPTRFFTGVPAPAGALLVLMPLFASLASPAAPHVHDALVGLYTVLIGGLMISRIPTFSFKTQKIYADNARYVVVGFVVIIAALASFPWATLILIDLLYLGSIALSWRAARRSVPTAES
jgi:CDP-diacylglycerol---serine O-phosphatidyltransferase